MILTRELRANPKQHYDAMVLYVRSGGNEPPGESSTKTIRELKRSMYLNTVPTEINTISTADMLSTSIICVSASVGAAFQITTDDPVEQIPLFSKGFAQAQEYGDNQYYILDSTESRSKMHDILTELYNMAVVPYPGLELEYIMMNRTPDDIAGELYV